MAITFQIKNLSQALANIDAYSNAVKQEIDDELTNTADGIVLDAQANVSPYTDKGALVASIRIERNDPMQKLIVAWAEYAAYVEFGTGALVDIPAEPPGLAEYAIQFKGAGIRQVNLPARPYFFPAFLSNTLELAKRFKAILETKI